MRYIGRYISDPCYDGECEVRFDRDCECGCHEDDPKD